MATNNSINTINLASFPANSLVGNVTGGLAAIAAVPTSTFLPTGGLQLKYVSQDGNDTTGDGSVLHPWATLSKAMSSITTATATTPFSVLVIGKITEATTVVIKPNISVYGYNAIVAITGTLNIDPTFLTVTSSQYYQNLLFTVTSNPTFDFSAAGASSHNTSFNFNTVGFTSATTFTIIGSLQETANFENCFNNNTTLNLTLTNLSNNNLFTSTLNTLIVQNTTASFIRSQIASINIYSSFTLKATSTGLMFCLARAINNSASITVDGASASLDIDTLETVPTLLNSGTWNPVTRYESIKGTSNGGIFYSNATRMQLLSGTATGLLPLLSGASTTPAWGAFPLSLGGALTTASTLTTAGAFTMSGAFTFTGTLTANTAVTFPTSGTLLSTTTGAALTKTDDTNVTMTLGGSPTTALVNAASMTLGWTGQLSLARGGSNASLTAATGGIVFSGASSLAILAPTATASQMLMSGSNAAPTWSTNTWPSTAANNSILYASAANTISALSSANSGVLITSNVGVPSISTTIPLITQRNITELNNITATFTLGGQLRTFCPAAGNIANSTSASGTFTPTIAFGGAAVGVTYSSQTGRYALTTLPDGSIRCDCWIQMTLTSKGSSTGVFTFTNLPLTSGTAGVYIFSVATENTITASGAQIFGVVNNSALTANFYYYTNNATAAQLSNTNIANNSTFRCYISYWNTN